MSGSQQQFGYIHFFRRDNNSWLGCLNPMMTADAWAEADRINGNPDEEVYAKVLADNTSTSPEVPKQ
jgi:hypothetical protein